MQIRRKGSAVSCVGQEYTGVYTIVHRYRAIAGRVRREVSWNGGSCARWIQGVLSATRAEFYTLETGNRGITGFALMVQLPSLPH